MKHGINFGMEIILALIAVVLYYGLRTLPRYFLEKLFSAIRKINIRNFFRTINLGIVDFCVRIQFAFYAFFFVLEVGIGVFFAYVSSLFQKENIETPKAKKIKMKNLIWLRCRIVSTFCGLYQEIKHRNCSLK